MMEQQYVNTSFYLTKVVFTKQNIIKELVPGHLSASQVSWKEREHNSPGCFWTARKQPVNEEFFSERSP